MKIETALRSRKRDKRETVDDLEMSFNHEKQARKVSDIHNDCAGKSGY